MGENLICDGQKFVTNQYTEDWLRVYRGYPEMNDHVKDMLRGYAKGGKCASILLFFSEKCGFDDEYSGFLMREVMRGNL